MTMSSSDRTYYDVLRICHDATQEEITSKYHDLARKYHPDRIFGNKKAHRKMMEINIAYETLRDPVKRRQYDESLGNHAEFDKSQVNDEHFSKHSEEVNMASERRKVVSVIVVVLVSVAAFFYWLGMDAGKKRGRNEVLKSCKSQILGLNDALGRSNEPQPWKEGYYKCIVDMDTWHSSASRSDR